MIRTVELMTLTIDIKDPNMSINNPLKKERDANIFSYSSSWNY